MSKIRNVLSLFDGGSGGQLALNRADIGFVNYYASEVDKYAMKITTKNFPDTKHLGDVNKWREWDIDWSQIDLVMGGSPCQGFSKAGAMGGTKARFKGRVVIVSDRQNYLDLKAKGAEFLSQSHLFWEYVLCLDHVKKHNPKVKFLLENVDMTKNNLDMISDALGVKPIAINSKLVSAQKRPRWYWCNWGNDLPEDKEIKLKDIVLDDVVPVALHNLYGGFKEKSVRVFTDKSPTIRTAAGGGHIPSFVKSDLIHSQKALDYMNREVKGGRNHWDFKHHSDIRDEKSSAVVANFFKGVPYNVFKDWDCVRKFHPVECERLQTIPDNYTEGVSNTQRYKIIGNGWTIDVIVHLLKNMVKSL